MSSSEENPYQVFKDAIRNSRVVSMPKNNIATFGNTIYNYYFVGKVDDRQTQVREGHIKINRPLFLNPFSQENIFKGFSEHHEELMKKLMDDIKVAPHLFVEYQFEHLPRHDWVESTPFPILLSEIKSNCQHNLFDVLLTGNTQNWAVALIKFCLKIIEKSLPINLNEIEERGLFDKNRIPPQLKKTVNDLFLLAEKKSNEISRLGDFLVENKIFEIYEDRFFELMEKSKKKNG